MPSYNSIFDSMWRSMFGLMNRTKTRRNKIFSASSNNEQRIQGFDAYHCRAKLYRLSLNYLNDLSTNGLREEGYTKMRYEIVNHSMLEARQGSLRWIYLLHPTQRDSRKRIRSKL